MQLYPRADSYFEFGSAKEYDNSLLPIKEMNLHMLFLYHYIRFVTINLQSVKW